MEFVNFKKLNKNAKTPLRATNGAAGYDLFACIDEKIIIKPKDVAKVPIGIAIEILNKNIVAYLFSRSSIGLNHKVSIPNSVGVVDSDYRGEIFVSLINHNDEDFIINPHDRIAQMIFSPVLLPEFKEVSELSKTKRGAGGFGSTGK